MNKGTLQKQYVTGIPIYLFTYSFATTPTTNILRNKRQFGKLALIKT